MCLTGEPLSCCFVFFKLCSRFDERWGVVGNKGGVCICTFKLYSMEVWGFFSLAHGYNYVTFVDT